MSVQSSPRKQMSSDFKQFRHFTLITEKMMKILNGWIPGVALWELKFELSRAQWENMNHSDQFRNRMKALRAGNVYKQLDDNLNVFLQVLAAAPSDFAFIQGMFGVFKPHLAERYHKYLQSADPVVDLPTINIIEQSLMQEEGQIQRIMDLYNQWPQSEESKKQTKEWSEYLKKLLDRMKAAELPEQEIHSILQPFEAFRPSPKAKRDERFETCFLLVPKKNAEEIEDEGLRFEIQVCTAYLREMQAMETLASVLYETDGMPWEFYMDICRHCWDEARHCLIGQRRFEQLGFDITKIPSMVGNYEIRQMLDPLHRFAHLALVAEVNSMKPKKKRILELENYGKFLTARLAEYDLVDEQNHVNYGYRWVPKLQELYNDTRSLEEVVEESKKQRQHAFELLEIEYM